MSKTRTAKQNKTTSEYVLNSATDLINFWMALFTAVILNFSNVKMYAFQLPESPSQDFQFWDLKFTHLELESFRKHLLLLFFGM